MYLGVIGTGAMGSALASGLAEAGHCVLVGSRDPVRGRAAGEAVGGGGGSYREVADAAAVVLLAVPWWSIDVVLPRLGDLTGTVLVDCTNPVMDASGTLQRMSASGAEEIARQVPGARVVKCFNHILAEVVGAGPGTGAPRPAAFLAGDDQGSKAVAAGLAIDLGYEPVDVGGLRAARMLEPLAALLLGLTHRGAVPADRALALVPQTPRPT